MTIRAGASSTRAQARRRSDCSSVSTRSTLAQYVVRQPSPDTEAMRGRLTAPAAAATIYGRSDG